MKFEQLLANKNQVVISCLLIFTIRQQTRFFTCYFVTPRFSLLIVGAAKVLFANWALLIEIQTKRFFLFL